MFINPHVQIKEAMKCLDKVGEKVLIVVNDQNRLLGMLSDGDLRRRIIKNGNLDGTVADCYNHNPIAVREDYDLNDVKQLMTIHKIELIPILDCSDNVVDVLIWSNLFENKKRERPKLEMPVVIMAGGKGTRLDPFTKILPKPLIPIGDKSIIEIIIDNFQEYKVNHFFISVNQKSKIIKSYFEELNPPYSISYIYEPKPLGTAGSLRYLQGKINGSFIVTNCDIIINADYNDIADFHIKNDNDITIVASMKQYRIPYGICEIENGGILSQIIEKPEYHFLVNTGMYILKASTLQLAPNEELFHMTHLIQNSKKAGGKIGVYPVSENSWIDTGEWEEYKNALKTFKIQL